MTADQKGALWNLVEIYAHDLKRELADTYLERIRKAGVDEIHFAWVGSHTPGKAHYCRLHGPNFIIEYDNTQNQANHVHTVWRDRDNDFGGDILLRHYREAGHGK